MAENSPQYVSTFHTDCPFVEVGCTSVLLSSPDYGHHLAQNIEQHLQMVVDLHRGGDIVSPLQRLNEVKSEIEFLETTLENLGVEQIPALECMKTQLKLPDVKINNLGDKCTFRMTGFSRLRDSSQKWFSPNFLIRGEYQLGLVVYPNGAGAGKGTHVSVFIVSKLNDLLHSPVSLHQHLGIRVKLLIESDGSVPGNEEDDLDTDHENLHELDEQSDQSYQFTWIPHATQTRKNTRWIPSNTHPSSQRLTESHLPSAKTNEIVDSERKNKLSQILPPWCQLPPKMSIDSPIADPVSQTDNRIPVMANNKSSDASRVTHSQRQQSGVSEKEETDPRQNEDGFVLFAAEKFATQKRVKELIRDFHSLVFQITLCLV